MRGGSVEDAVEKAERDLRSWMRTSGSNAERIIQAVELIRQHLGEMTFADFEKDQAAQHYVYTMVLKGIREALQRGPPATVQQLRAGEIWRDLKVSIRSRTYTEDPQSSHLWDVRKLWSVINEHLFPFQVMLIELMKRKH